MVGRFSCTEALPNERARHPIGRPAGQDLITALVSSLMRASMSVSETSIFSLSWMNWCRASLSRSTSPQVFTQSVYTFVVRRHGRIILKTDRSAFDAEIARYERNLATFRGKVLEELEAARADFEEMLVAEFLPRWRRNPPPRFARSGWPATAENLDRELRRELSKVIDEALHYGETRIRLVYKDVAYESVSDPGFKDALSEAMRGRVPADFIENLFPETDAAPAAPSRLASTLDEDVPF